MRISVKNAADDILEVRYVTQNKDIITHKSIYKTAIRGFIWSKMPIQPQNAAYKQIYVMAFDRWQVPSDCIVTRVAARGNIGNACIKIGMDLWLNLVLLLYILSNNRW